MEKYDNLGMVGEGSYGMVMKCKHKESGQIVAIKKFLESEDDKMVKKIAMREVRMLRKLRHENLVNLIEVFRRRKRLYLVFEFVDHTVLDDLEKYPNGLNEMTVRKTLWQVLRGIEFCHSHNIIHRDIKPENILNSRSGVIKICDFGFARTLAAPGEIYTDYVATRWYRAPELLVGDTKYGRAIDIWAVGCLIGEMLTGDPVFPGKSDIDQIHRIAKYFGNLSPRHREIFQRNPLFAGMRLPEVKEVDPLEKRFPRFSSEVLDLMKQCLRLDPNDRPSSSALLRHEFFKKDNFEEKIIPEIRNRIQKEHQQSLIHRKSIAEKLQKEKEAENRKNKKAKETTTSGGKDTTPPSNKDAVTKESPRNENKTTQGKSTNVDSPKKDSLAILKPQQTNNRTPPSDEIKRMKEQEKAQDRKLPPAIKQDNTMVTGGVISKQSNSQKLQTPPTSKDDFSSPRTLIPKMTNESKVKVKEVANKPADVPAKSSYIKESFNDVKRLSKDDLASFAKPEQSTPIKPPGILKNTPQGGGGRASVTVETSSSRVSERALKPEHSKQTGVNKTMSDTTVMGSKDRGKGEEKLSTSTPTSSTVSQTNTKSPQENSKRSNVVEQKTKEKVTFKDQTTTFKEANGNPDSNKLGGHYIPPIQSYGGPTPSNKSVRETSGLETSSSSENFKSPGIKVLEKTKKVMTTTSKASESFSSQQSSYEKSMYGNTVSNFEKMMLSMSGATSISHPAIKKSTTILSSNQQGSPSTISGYAQSQFGHHFSQARDDKSTGSNLPLWSSNASSYFEKHSTNIQKNAVNDNMIKGSDHDKKQHRTTDERTHHRHHHKQQEKSEQLKHFSKMQGYSEDKSTSQNREAKRTRLPDLLGRSVGPSTTTREDSFPSLKPTGNDYHKRKQKKPILATIPNIDQHDRMQINTSPNNIVSSEHNLPSVRRKN